MTTFLHFTYNCLHLLNQYIGAFWPVKVFFGTKRLQPPSTETELTILRVFYLLQHKSEIAKFGFDIIDLVSSLPLQEDVLSIHEKTTGYNLLQLAIIDRNSDLVLCLMKWQFNESVPQCSPYIHLASSIGHLPVLEHLLDNGGKCDLIAGICYPDPHQPIRYKKWLGMIDQPVYKCNSNGVLPIYWAIAGDNVHCFTLLLYHMIEKGEVTPSPVDLLHFACCKGANDCIGKILSKNPSIVNSVDVNKNSPLLMAVVWGKVCSKTLIDYGADVRIISNIGETALHRLYRTDIDGLFTIYETTKYLLTTGIEQLINYKNNNGETPLHVLVTHVSYIGGCITSPDDVSSQVPRIQLQPDYQNQVIDTLDLLLKFNADPRSKNSHGLHPLAKLMHIALKSCSTDSEQTECVRSSISSVYKYKNDYGHLHKALAVLIKHGSELNMPCSAGHTPLYLILQCLMNDDIENLGTQKNDISKLLHLLLANGATIKETYSNYYTVLAKLAARYFSVSSGDSSDKLQVIDEYSSLVNQLLETFLRNGFNPNIVTETKSQYLRGGTGNALIDFVRLTELASHAKDFSEIHKWLKTLLAWGANPDLEPYPSEPVICHSQSSIFLKRQGTQAVSHYIDEVKDMETIFTNGNAQELLMLFYNTMSHDILYSCLNTARSMSNFHTLSGVGQPFFVTLNNLAENPRSLKQIARVTIYKSINRNMVQKVPKLPLPRLLKDYLIEIY